VLPLIVPTLLLGTRSIDMAMAGLAAGGPLLWLAALLALMLAVTPFATAAALRVHLD
jgi:heme exporter protein B